MNTGKLVRLNRLFSHSSGRLCSVAIDHFIIYQDGLPEGLRDVPETLKAVARGKPDAVTMHIGFARSTWQNYAGSIPLILQSSLLRVDESDMAQAATPEDAVVMGADAFAVCCFVRGTTELCRHRDDLRPAQPLFCCFTARSGRKNCARPR